MSDTHRQDLVDVAAEAWLASLVIFAAIQPGGYHRRGEHGTCELVTTAPMPSLNGVFAVGPKADPAEVAEFANSPALASMPWCIQVRSERIDERIAATAAEHGLTQQSTLPFMLKELSESDAKLPDSDASVRRLTGKESEIYTSALAAGFEAPPEAFDKLASPAALDHPATRAYVAEVGGTPVATAFGVLVGDMVGVYNISVPPEHRRRGYGRLASAAVLQDAYAAGVQTAFLHTSDMGQPVYQGMGFQIVENWTLLHA